MNTEQQKIEYKSLQKIRTGEKGFKELSTTCVALANAQGGQIMIGVEDKTKKLFNGNLYQHSLSWKMRIRRISQNSLMIYANLIE